jgi:hypothetical protein
MSDYHTEKRWRPGDPETSREAAEAIYPHLNEIQAEVERYARDRRDEGFTDAQLAEHFQDSTSTYRTRRSELSDRNIIVDSGRRAKHGDSERNRVVWVHREWIATPPPLRDPPTPKASAAEIQEAQLIAAKLPIEARGLRGMGMAPLADYLDRTAELLSKLAG